MKEKSLNNQIVIEDVDYEKFEKKLGKLIDKNDFIVPAIVDSPFKYLFGTEENKDFLKLLLKVILDLKEEELEDLTFSNTEMIPEFLEEKKVFLDVRVKLKDGTEIDIEIQRVKKKELLSRFLFYWSRMYVNQGKIGRKYTDLKKCISINLLDFKLTEYDDCHLTYHIYEDKHKALFNDMLEIHLIEMPQIENLRESNEKLYSWLRFLRTDSRKEMKEMSEMTPELKKVMERMLSYNLDGEMQLRAFKEYNYLLDELNLEEDAREIGMEEGMKEGMKKASFLIAQNLKRNKVDTAVIMESTGLSMEEIDKL